MAIVEVLKTAHHVKDGAEAVGDKVNVAIEGAFNTLATHKSIVNATRWQGSQSDENGNFVDAIAIRKPSPSSLALSADARLFQGSPGRVALRRNSTRGGQRSGSNVPRWSSPDDGGSGGDASIPRRCFHKGGSRARWMARVRAGACGRTCTTSLVLSRGGRGLRAWSTSASRRVGRTGKRQRSDGAGCDGRKRVSADGKVPTHFQLGNCVGREPFGAVSHAQLKHRADVLDYLHRSDVVHVKLSDFGLSLDLRAMERAIKDTTGPPIELLTVTGLVLLSIRIVEDESPPTPERFSNPLVAFLKGCFHMARRQTDLFEYANIPSVKTTFRKPCQLSYAWSRQRRRGALFALQLVAHSKCAGRPALTCDLRSTLLIHAHFAERGNSLAEFFTRLPSHHPASASLSRGTLDRDRDQRERERANSPQLSPTSPPHPPIAYKILSPFNSAHVSLLPDKLQFIRLTRRRYTTSRKPK
ncbi:hypothetical protein EDB92DRAFT_2108637 [Lactarius akahatsu]|uniref:Uncharacterized protein n=1 Tax=Lactarius akahatsu TaxID=416441 RepID=A0AAD4L9M0_9AGAM|nr:hypothetical protein EDB92DRAFT_2108637 [Lactarius akahatsu]